MGSVGRRGIKGRKKWDTYNSIINKIYLKKKIDGIEVLNMDEVSKERYG